MKIRYWKYWQWQWGMNDDYVNDHDNNDTNTYNWYQLERWWSWWILSLRITLYTVYQVAIIVNSACDAGSTRTNFHTMAAWKSCRMVGRPGQGYWPVVQIEVISMLEWLKRTQAKFREIKRGVPSRERSHIPVPRYIWRWFSFSLLVGYVIVP